MFTNKNLDGDVLVIGGANVDRTYRVKEPHIQVSEIDIRTLKNIPASALHSNKV